MLVLLVGLSHAAPKGGLPDHFWLRRVFRRVRVQVRGGRPRGLGEVWLWL